MKESPTDDMPKKLPKKDSTVNQESFRPVSNTQNRTAPKGGFESIRNSKKKESSIKPKGGFGICPDSGERGQEREEVLNVVQEITKGNGEVNPIQNSRDTAPYRGGGNSHFKSGWEGLEQPNGRYDLGGRDLSWGYSDANISCEGSYLVATSRLNGDLIVTKRRKSRGDRQKFRANSTQTPYRNKTSVKIDKEPQMTPQKANTSLRETISKETDGTVVLLVKTGTKRKKKKKLVEYDKARLHPPVLGMTEEEMLRRGPMCKDCHKEHYGQVCPSNKCGWIHPHHGCLNRPFTPEEIPTITEVPPEDSETKEIKLTVPIKGKHWCWLYMSHGPEEVCPRKNEVSTEYGRQRVKELLQEMVKTEEKSRLDQGENGKIPEVNQKVWVLGTPLLVTTKEEFVGPKVTQPLEEKTPHVKPVEVGGEAQWLSKPTTSTKDMGSTGGQPPRKST